MIGNVIQSKFLELIDYPAAAALSFVLMAAIVALVAIYARSLGHGEADRMIAVVRRHALTAYALLAFGYLLLPIAVVIAFSFNDPAGRFNYTWQGFTLDNWRTGTPCPGSRDSMILSLEIAALASVVATALGTLIALALVRHGFRGRSATNLLVFLPMSTPEIVLGASLLALFLQLRIATGFLDDRDRARHVHHQLRRRHREGAARSASTGTSRKRRWTSAPTSGRRSGR